MLLRRLTLCIALAAAVPAVTEAGGFGRPRPSLLDGLIPRQFWQGPVTGYSGFPLTDLEVELRDRSYVLIRPNEPRGNWNIYIAGFQIVGAFRRPISSPNKPRILPISCGRPPARKPFPTIRLLETL